MPQGLWWAVLVGGVVSSVLLLAALSALWNRRFWKTCSRVLLGTTFLAVTAALAAVGIGIQGYRAFIYEEVAATLHIEPVEPKRFRAHFRFADGRIATYLLTGDQIYVDAHIIKWHPLANILGLHTLYELDRVAGRYNDLADEQHERRTVYALTPERAVDLFSLRRRFASLSPAFDADYGSAAYTAAGTPSDLEIRVTASGLIVRPIAPPNPGS